MKILLSECSAGLAFLFFLFNTASSAAPHFSTVSEDARIVPTTVAVFELTVRAANHFRQHLIH